MQTNVNMKNNNLTETLDSLDYFELSKEEAVDLTLRSNKQIIEIVMEDEYQESDYEETSHMIESSSISFDDLQGEEFITDSEEEEDKRDCLLPIIQKDMIYKKIHLSIKE